MERRIGFSTGALAFGDFARGIALQDTKGVSAIELSSLREHELQGAIDALHLLENDRFTYRSFHAPSQLQKLTDRTLVDALSPVASLNIPIVIHPDIIQDFGPWKELGGLVLLENMDRRKSDYRTSVEMLRCFQELPEARLCFDIGHARQVDPSMAVALDFLLRHRSRLAEVHISEVNWECHHTPISTTAALAFQRLARRIPEDVPIIIESILSPEQIKAELSIVRRCLDPTESLLSVVGPNQECTTA